MSLPAYRPDPAAETAALAYLLALALHKGEISPG